MFETGKIYTPVGFLPGLTRTGRPRPQASLRDDAVMIFLGVFTLVVPSTMRLFGDLNWWAPGSLGRHPVARAAAPAESPSTPSAL